MALATSRGQGDIIRTRVDDIRDVLVRFWSLFHHEFGTGNTDRNSLRLQSVQHFRVVEITTRFGSGEGTTLKSKKIFKNYIIFCPYLKNM